MAQSITTLNNPFQRSNPFTVHSQPPSTLNTSLPSYSSKPTYRQYQAPTLQPQKQNTYLKSFTKQQPQMWKFHQNNCQKAKLFSSQASTGTLLGMNERMYQEKNSFEKQLVLGNITKNKTQGPQQHERDNVRNQPIQNPFNRKYLVGGNTQLAESQVYVGYKERGTQPAQYQTLTKAYERPKTEYQPYVSRAYQQTLKYNNYVSYDNHSQQHTSQSPPLAAIGSSAGLQTSIYHRNTLGNNYASNKSIQNENYAEKSYNQYGDNYQKPVESQYMIGDRANYGSNHDTRPQYGYQSTSSKHLPPFGGSRASLKGLGASRGSRRSLSSKQKRDEKVKRMESPIHEKDEKVRFDQESDEENQQKDQAKSKVAAYKSNKQIPQLKGPETISIKGRQFFRQRVQTF